MWIRALWKLANQTTIYIMNDQISPAPKSMNKNVIIMIVGVLIVVMAGVLFIFADKIFQMPQENFRSEDTGPKYDITQAPAGELPNQFPKDFPLEAGAVVDNGYNISEPTNTQATIHFISKNNLDKSFKIYSDYLNKANGWTVLTTLNTSTVKSISAQNADGATVLVSMAQNVVTKVNQVTISFVYKK